MGAAGATGSEGSTGSTGVVRRIKIWKRRGDLKLAVFSYRKPNPSLPVTSHQSLIPAFKLLRVFLSRIVIPSVVEGSFLHCGQYHISIGRETMPWRYIFLLSHIHRLSVCKKDFSLRSK